MRCYVDLRVAERLGPAVGLPAVVAHDHGPIRNEAEGGDGPNQDCEWTPEGSILASSGETM